MKNNIKKSVLVIFFLLLLAMLAGCNSNVSSKNPWVGNWYGYIDDTFYKLTFTKDYATL